jgi:ADP-heptose:LPS heptosyltransferase
MVKYLVIRFSSIGDIVLASPLIRCLKEQVEDAEVHFLTKKQFAPILQANPYIHKVHLLADNSQQTIQDLKKEQFDYVLDLQNGIRSVNIKRSLKRMFFTVNKLNLRKWLMVNFKVNRLPDKHIVDRYLETAKLFDVKNDGQGLDYFIPEEDLVGRDTLPHEIRKGYIALVIGAQHATKRLPSDQLIKLISNLEYPVVIIGGPEDKSRAEEIIQACAQHAIYNACGAYSVNQSASIIQQSNCVISNDTGMMHIAAAFKKRIITLWGNTIHDFGMYAYLPGEGSVDFEVKDLSCRPCSKLGFEKCPKKHFDCMMNQDLASIAGSANALFKGE